MLAACLQGYHEGIYDHLAGNDRVFKRGIVAPLGSVCFLKTWFLPHVHGCSFALFHGCIKA